MTLYVISEASSLQVGETHNCVTVAILVLLLLIVAASAFNNSLYEETKSFSCGPSQTHCPVIDAVTVLFAVAAVASSEYNAGTLNWELNWELNLEIVALPSLLPQNFCTSTELKRNRLPSK